MLTKEATKTDLSQKIDEVLSDLLKINIEQSKAIGISYERLWQELERLVLSGGKRTRPKIMLLTYRAFGGSSSKGVLEIAAAMELFHQFLLIHDDIIDRDFVRYGVLNIAGAYKDIYKGMIENENDRIHHANGATMLGGNLLLGGAHKLINDADIDIEDKLRVGEMLYQAHFEVGGGELLDIESAFKYMNPEEALSVARYKTAGYSFIMPVVIGAILAGAPETTIKKLSEFAENLGKAFQLNDDLLGMFGEQHETGKSNSTDLLEGKGTYLVATFFESSSASQQETFRLAFANAKANDDEIRTAKDLLIESGARSKTEDKIREFESAAISALDSLNL
ncbi:MAG: geranylgeranyl diphosphate synthase, type, partial [Patescibacteria group bacterium]|nr:geranylgeranyl diphosphate synthase, type [Patescibacteria group bacterium]